MFKLNQESYGPDKERQNTPARDGDELDLVKLHLDPYGEGTTFVVNWEVSPKDPCHAVWTAQVIVHASGVAPVRYNILAHDSNTSGGLNAPPGLLVRGESSHVDIPPGTKVRIEIFGQVQVASGANKWYSICRTVISGEQDQKPCASP